MASFLEAYKITMSNEGGYSDDINDVGGETYKGIARKYHPSWYGWQIIDMLKQQPGFPSTAFAHDELNTNVRDFYKTLYWDVNLLDNITSQAVANEMFDTGVNLGVNRAAKYLQKTLNILNKNELLWNDITEDGKIGNNTLTALDACLSYRGDKYIYKILNIMQGQHYIEYMTKSPTQEKYAYGWLNRVDFIRK